MEKKRRRKSEIKRRVNEELARIKISFSLRPFSCSISLENRKPDIQPLVARANFLCSFV